MSNRTQRTIRMTRLGVHLSALSMLLVGTVVYAVLIIRPQHVARQGFADRTERLDALRKAAMESRSTETELRETLAQIHRREAEIRARIPAHADEHEFLQTVNQAAKETGLEVVDYQRTGSADELTHSTLRLDVKCRGDYSAMCHFLERIRNLQRLVIVEHLHVVSDMASAEHDFSLSLVLIHGLNVDAPTGEFTDV